MRFDFFFVYLLIDWLPVCICHCRWVAFRLVVQSTYTPPHICQNMGVVKQVGGHEDARVWCVCVF